MPHGVAHQVTAAVDRYVLGRFAPLSPLGVSHIGVTLGLGLKLFLSAFETAWAPFYFREMRAPDAKWTFRTMTTYCTACSCSWWRVSRRWVDLVRLTTAPTGHAAAAVVPWIGLASGSRASTF